MMHTIISFGLGVACGILVHAFKDQLGQAVVLLWGKITGKTTPPVA